MTNLFKRFFTHKSKFLLIILCLLGMVFSYSCSCRNDSTGPGNDGNGGGGPPTGSSKNSFTANPDNMNNHLDLYIQSDYKTNSVVVIKFKSKQNISGATITEIKHKSGTDIKLTTQELDYNLQNFELQLGGNENTRKKIADALTKEGETSTITLTLELTSDSENLENDTTSIDVDVNLIKTIKITEENMNSIFNGVGTLTPGMGLGYDFDFSSPKLSGSKFEVQNKGTKSADSITPITFATELMSESTFGFGAEEVKKLGFISTVKVEFIEGSISGDGASFNVTFTFAPKYEATLTKYTLNANAKSINGSKTGAWKTN